MYRLPLLGLALGLLIGCSSNDSTSSGPATSSSGSGHSSSGSGGGASTGGGGPGGTMGAGASGGNGMGGSSMGGSGTGGSNTGGSSTGSGGALPASGTIVPLYSYPSDSSWTDIATAAQAHPTVAVLAIINPNSGPGDSHDPMYTSGIAGLLAANITPLGYVATTYGKKPSATAKNEIDTYLSFYPALQGIFFDEMSNTPGDEGYYSDLTAYVTGKGLELTVGNPGIGTPASFVGTVRTMFIYESNGLPSLSSLSSLPGAPKNFGIIPYDVPSLDTGYVMQARAYVGFVYITNDNLPNPWDTLSPYFGNLLGALE